MQPKDIALTRLDGTRENIDQYQGKLWLVVNTASKCGFTPQYEELEALWQQYQHRGLVVMGFPCNQFMHQEPGSNQAIASFCDLNFKVSFPMYSKIEVNGPETHPLYAWLKKNAPGVLGSRAVKWNFTKFLVAPSGQVKRYAPRTAPMRIKDVIEQWLPAGD
ncbi:glutathione peroxidase [Gallaecimonas pentaromativorans]|uniref:Glutathione peroxidase n=1 Tax=Gallaecimonas pentaromativorans TaxID=584787 RepID=A0A3N1PDQ5_9GAMM|nr:glutathione peroxidase [Gallaecimonas pentaromativorans]ROQ24930.1 glutathione peroxidase [Gallaecimonas pentaromativorans]